MKTTSEILKALAPEFVALDELYNKWKSPGVNATEHSKLVNLMDTQTRALLDSYAQALAMGEGFDIHQAAKNLNVTVAFVINALR